VRRGKRRSKQIVPNAMERGNEVCETEMFDPDSGGPSSTAYDLLLSQIETFECGQNYSQSGER
jgi:hypothetical protein